MTIAPNVTVSSQFPFPATVKGSGPVIIGKVGGVWTVALTIAQLAPLLIGFDPTTKLILIYDQITGSFVQTTVSTLLSSVTGVGSVRIVTAAGPVTIGIGDSIILMNKTVGAATNINLPTSASRAGVPVTVKDYKGDANANNITFVPSGAETIDGFSPAAAIANGSALIESNYGKKILYPLPAGGWYL